jgi:hypothetical protein
VVVRERERGGGGVDVEFEAADERVQVRQIGGAGTLLGQKLVLN